MPDDPVAATRLIHLSDIHFGGYGGGWDENKDQRNELVMDVQRLVTAGGPVDGVLVGGDIAYHAWESEYDEATTWLGEVCAAGQCLPGRVWTVPGNHDLDRGAHNRTMARRALLQAAREAELTGVDKVLSDWFIADPTAEGLLHCMAAYNSFAGQWGCETAAASLSWKDETLALDGWDIYLTGLNSVIVSDSRDWDGGPTLTIGRFQCELPRAPDRIHVAFMHHPPTWLRDWDRVDSLLRSRAHILLFGHEHAFAARQIDAGGTVEVFAGAVGPHPGADGSSDCVPSWNMITMRREGTELVVTIDPRTWCDQHRFEQHPDGLSEFRINHDLSGAPEPGPDAAAEPEDASPLIVNVGDEMEPMPNPAVRSDLRELAVRFMKLTPERRDQIAQQLGIDTDLDDGLGARERPRELLRRVGEAGKVTDLKEAMNA